MQCLLPVTSWWRLRRALCHKDFVKQILVVDWICENSFDQSSGTRDVCIARPCHVMLVSSLSISCIRILCHELPASSKYACYVYIDLQISADRPPIWKCHSCRKLTMTLPRLMSIQRPMCIFTSGTRMVTKHLLQFLLSCISTIMEASKKPLVDSDY